MVGLTGGWWGGRGPPYRTLFAGHGRDEAGAARGTVLRGTRSVGRQPTR